MSAIINLSINLEKLDKSKIIKGKKGSYVNLTVFANDETKFENNASIAQSQSQEEREASKASGVYPPYLGNGKVVYVSDAGVTVAEKSSAPQESSSDDSGDLPF
jgi:hypothetical protein|tara:strand:+ start:420 stop:731 length:312 start_codon:yes stop_codon:yes gene_type:complete